MKPLSAMPDFTLRTFLLFVLLLVFARLVMAAILPMPPDEAYYRLWSENLQWGYHDHPPMIAVWIRLGREFLGESLLGTRTLPILAGAATSLGVYGIAREFGIVKPLALLGALWVQCVWSTAQIALGGVGTGLATPDSPTTFFWTFACLCAVRGACRKSTGWWLAGGVLAGLACLSKYTGFFLAPGLLLWLATSPRYRSSLATPGPWLAALVAAAVFSPHLAWNVANEWQTFVKQFGRAVPDRFDPLRPLALLEILLNVGPALVVAFAAGAWRPLVGFVRNDIRGRETPVFCAAHFYTAISVPLLVYMVLHSFHSEVLTHWLTPLYPGMGLVAALAVSGASGAWCAAVPLLVVVSAIDVFILLGPSAMVVDIVVPPEPGSAQGPRLRWYALSLVLALLSLLLLFAGVFAARTNGRRLRVVAGASIAIAALSALVFWLRVHEPRGHDVWRSLALEIGEEAHMRGAGWIGTSSYQLYAHLHPHLGEDPGLVLLDRSRVDFNRPLAGREMTVPGLVVRGMDDRWIRAPAEGSPDMASQLRACFGRVSESGIVRRETDASIGTRRYALYLVSEPERDPIAAGC